jgi:hypothetical protein
LPELQLNFNKSNVENKSENKYSRFNRGNFIQLASVENINSYF